MEPSERSCRLSVAMIVRNCAAALAETIGSVRVIAGEIIVLDTGSTDDTPAVAARLGASVHRHSWDDDFAAARNACLARATGDWVLWLDAGETISAEHASQLAEFLVSAADPAHAYALYIVVPAADDQVGSEQIARLRLHARRSGLRFDGRVRERMDASLAELGIQLDALPLAICRGSREHETATKAAKAQRNIRLADLATSQRGPSAEMQNVLGEAFQSLGDCVRAAQHYRRAIDLAQPGSREHLEAFYGLLSCLEGAGSERSDQLSLCMLAVEHFPLDAQLLVALGGYLQLLDQAPLAIRAFDLAFRHGQVEPQVWHLPDIREIAAACAATAMIAAGQQDAARTLLAAAACTFPHSQRLATQLAELEGRSVRVDPAASAGLYLPRHATPATIEPADIEPAAD